MEIKLKLSQVGIKLNTKEIFKNLFDFNWGTFFTDSFDTNSPVELKAFILLFTTAQKTYVELAKKIGQDELNNKDNLLAVTYEVENHLKNFFEEEVVIKKEFFNDIVRSNNKYLTGTYLIFEHYLKLLDIPIEDGLNYKYFILFQKNISEAYQEKKDYYIDLYQYFENPLEDEFSTFEQQLNYYIKIKKYFTNKLQNEVDGSCETLSDLYISPNFSIYRNNYFLTKDFTHNDFVSDTSISIHDFINDFFLKGIRYDKCLDNYNMLFILGQPGQGKTSFCYKVIFDYLNKYNDLPPIPIYLIKIRDLIAQDFITNPFESIKSYLDINVDFRSTECILVLDGLDEAFMSGGLNDHDLRNLYDRLNKTSQHNKMLKIILTSRFNYLKITDSCIDKTLVLQLNTLSDSQIKEYSAKFIPFYPENNFVKKIDIILDNSKYTHIKELLQQAVLIYFIAISDINVEENDSRARIYDKIFSTLTKRSWDSKKQLDYMHQDLRYDSKRFERYLREFVRSIAFEIYQSPHLYITLDYLQSLYTTEKFINNCFDKSLTSNDRNLREISKYLLISFYFQDSKNNSNEAAIEFFHNSLWEYLTAEYIWEELKNFLLQKDYHEDLIIKNKSDFFILLDRLIGQKQFNSVVRENLQDIILNEDVTINTLVFESSRKLFYELLSDDFLLEYRRENNSLTSFEKAVNIFELAWTFYYYSRINLEEGIECGYSVNRYLFNLSNAFFSEYDYKNIDFHGSMEIKNLDRNNFINVRIDKLVFENFWMLRNFFCDSTLQVVFASGSLISNVFNKVHFINCSFTKHINIRNNDFVDCTFDNVSIPSKGWYRNFIKENYVRNADQIQIISKSYKVDNKIKTRFYMSSKNEGFSTPTSLP